MKNLNKKLNKKLLIIAALVLAAACILFAEKDTIMSLKKIWNPIVIRNWINSFGKFGILIYVLLQVFQVVIFAVPGEVVQVAGGYIYNAFWGTILSLIGIFIGSCITFAIGRRFGEDLLKKLIPPKHYNEINTTINRPKNKLVILILYLIPGIPKDILGYIAGITKISFRSFALISTLGRIPGVFISAYMGANIYNRNYALLLISAILLLILFILIMIYKDKIIKYFTKQ